MVTLELPSITLLSVQLPSFLVKFEEVLGSILGLVTLFCKSFNHFKWFVW